MKRPGRMPVFLFALLFVSYLVGPTVHQSSAHIGEFVFDSVVEPVGVAASPTRLYITHPACGNDTIVRFSDGGPMATLVTIPRPASRQLSQGCFEDYVAIAAPVDSTVPGLFTKGGFPSNSLLVTQGRLIKQVTTIGTVSVSLFAIIPNTIPGFPCSDASATGITFDRVGAPGGPVGTDFDANAIATCSEGTVWMINKNGVVTPIANVPASVGGPVFRIEGPESIPSSYGLLSGRVLVFSETRDRFFAVAANGTVTEVGRWRNVDGGRFVPPPANKCNFVQFIGQTVISASFFTTVFSQGAITNTWAFPGSAFAGHNGKLVLSSAGTAGFGLQTSPGSTPSAFHASLGRTEDMAFVDCQVPITASLLVKGGPSDNDTINPTGQGSIQVAILGSRVLNATDILLQDSDNDGFYNTPTAGTFFTGNEQSIPVNRCEIVNANNDAFPDLRCHANTNRINWSAAPGFPNNPPCFASNGHYLCQLLVKFKFTSTLLAPGTDPDGEGFN